MNSLLLRGSKQAVLLRAALVIAAIALLDYAVVGQIPLGFLYLLPMLMVGGVAGRASIFGAAMVCTCLAEIFSDLAWTVRTGISRDILFFAAFEGAGLFIRQVTLSRQAAADNLKAIETERDARRDAEEQLKILVESSPVAIFTADSKGAVLMANEAAHRMMGTPEGTLTGKLIHRYLPALSNVTLHDESLQLLRAVMQARGYRDDGEAFMADICFSTYQTNAGIRLAAMVLDASEDLRAHEVAGMQQLLEGSRIAVGALSHEIRNICGAIAVVHQNLKNAGTLKANKDFEALGSLIIALERIASINLSQTASPATEVDLTVLLDELKIVVGPSLIEEEIETEWNIERGLPLVWGDRSSLMQVFLNLISNSSRALSRQSQRKVVLNAKRSENHVCIEVVDNGGGVEHPEHLFRPFQAGAESTGLGLYIARAFLRSFKGDLRYIPTDGGACFVVELMPAIEAAEELQYARTSL